MLILKNWFGELHSACAAEIITPTKCNILNCQRRRRFNPILGFLSIFKQIQQTEKHNNINKQASIISYISLDFPVFHDHNDIISLGILYFHCFQFDENCKPSTSVFLRKQFLVAYTDSIKKNRSAGRKRLECGSSHLPQKSRWTLFVGRLCIFTTIQLLVSWFSR